MSRPERIGSDFGFPDETLLRDGAAPSPLQTILVRSGRQALTMVARALRTRGTVWMPEFHCDSMVQPFVAEGAAVRFYPLDRDLWPNVEDLSTLSDAVVLVAPYFGRVVPESLLEGLRTLAEGETTTVVIDETHALFDDPLPGDVHVASLRKLLPLGEGGSVRGLDPTEPPPGPPRGGYAVRETAARLRAAGDGNFEATREMFRSAEGELSDAIEPEEADPRLVQLLARLDLAELARRRRENAAVLKKELARRGLEAAIAPLAGYGEDATPAYLTCTTNRPRALQAYLAERRIYCPVHWPPSRYRGGGTWRSDLISIPVDHRYDDSDMERLVDEITSYFKG